MRKLLAAAAVLLSLQARPAHAQEAHGDFGLGIQVGAPTGLNMKYYMDRFAIQAGLGIIERGWDDGTHIFADVVFHPAVITTTNAFTMPFYVGVGGRILDDGDDEYCRRGRCYGDYDDDDLDVGVRIPVGLLMAFHKVPIDAFLELAPTLDLINDDDETVCFDGECYRDWDGRDDRFSIYVTLGARYYF
jgi:hypothetical protein